MDNQTQQDELIVERKIIYFFIKRLVDIVLSLLAIIILSPLLLVIMILVKATSKGPVFFKHTRVGKNHKDIGVWKFRTMVTNAEELIKQFTPEQKKEFEENFKLEDDPRVTSIGNFLRKTSLDELPQLFNILGGSMSIVGPRPITEGELHFFGDKIDNLLSVTPGLTGLWACTGRSNVTYGQRVRLELFYVDHCSLGLDILIIFKTFFAVLKGHGAR